MFDTVTQDLRYAIRGLHAKPGLTVAVILTPGLALGPNAATRGNRGRPALGNGRQSGPTAVSATGGAKTASPPKNTWNMVKSPSLAPQATAPALTSTIVPR